MGFSQADREKLLPGVVKKFQDALYWGSPNQAIEFVSADRRRDMMTQLSKDVDGIRIVESKIGAINYSEESRKATAEVTIKFFKVPFYIVTERIELQEWQFTLSDGWKLNSKSDKPKGS